MISRLTRSALCWCIVLLPPALYSCSRFLFSTHYTRCTCTEPSQFSGMVSLYGFRYASCVGLNPQSMKERQRRTRMSCEENKALVRRFVEEFWNQGNTAAADELMTADATIILPGRGQVSKENFKAFAVTLRGAFPHWHTTLEEMIAEDDQVAERWTARRTNQGEFQGITTTGSQVTVTGFGFYRVASSKSHEFRRLFDRLSFLQQLGAILEQK